MSVVDPRITAAKRNLEKFSLVIPVLSPKGGVGKTSITALMAYSLALDNEFTVSLLDADFTNPNLHIVLGLDESNLKIEEEMGIKPIKVAPGIELMTLAAFVKDLTVPLRGNDIVNVIRELLAITRWNGKIMLIDSPPGFSDTHLEFLRLLIEVKEPKVLLVSTPTALALKAAERITRTLLSENIKILGLIGNMCLSVNDENTIAQKAQQLTIPYLGCIPYISNVEQFYGTSMLELVKKIGTPLTSIAKIIKKQLY